MTTNQTQTVFTTVDVRAALDLGDMTLAKRLLALASSGVQLPQVTLSVTIPEVNEPARRGRVSHSGGNHPMIGQVLAWLPKAPEYVTASLVEETFPALGGSYQVIAVLEWLEEQKVLGQGERAKGRTVLVRDVPTLTALAAQHGSSEITAIPDEHGGKRSRADLAAIRTKVLDFIAGSEGQRVEQISLAMGTESRAIVGPIKHLIGEKLVRTEGQKRGTMYFATSKGKALGSTATALVATKDEKPAKKRVRKPASAPKKASAKKAGASKKRSHSKKPPVGDAKLPEATASATSDWGERGEADEEP